MPYVFDCTLCLHDVHLQEADVERVKPVGQPGHDYFKVLRPQDDDYMDCEMCGTKVFKLDRTQPFGPKISS